MELVLLVGVFVEFLFVEEGFVFLVARELFREVPRQRAVSVLV